MEPARPPAPPTPSGGQGLGSAEYNSEVPIIVTLKDIFVMLSSDSKLQASDRDPMQGQVKAQQYFVHISTSYSLNSKLITLPSKVNSHVNTLLFDNVVLTLPALDDSVWIVSGKHPYHSFIIISVTKDSDRTEVACTRIPLADAVDRTNGSEFVRKYKLYGDSISWDDEHSYIAMCLESNYSSLTQGAISINENKAATKLTEVINPSYSQTLSIFDPVLHTNHPDNYIRLFSGSSRLGKEVPIQERTQRLARFYSTCNEHVLDIRSDVELNNPKKGLYKHLASESVKIDGTHLICGRLILTNLRVLFVPYRSQAEDVIFKLFDHLDADGSGVITIADLKEIYNANVSAIEDGVLSNVWGMESLNSNFSAGGGVLMPAALPEDILRLFERLDKDGDGEVTFDELMRYIMDSDDRAGSGPGLQDFSTLSLPLWQIAYAEHSGESADLSAKSEFDFIDDRSFVVSVRRHVEMEDKAGKAYTAYEVQVTVHSLPDESWTVLRRFQEFHELHSSLLASAAKDALPPLPPKDGVTSIFTKHTEHFLAGRQESLDAYVRSLSSASKIWAEAAFLRFLDHSDELETFRKLEEYLSINSAKDPEDKIARRKSMDAGGVISRLSNFSTFAQTAAINNSKMVPVIARKDCSRKKKMSIYKKLQKTLKTSRSAFVQKRAQRLCLLAKDGRSIVFSVKRFSETQMVSAGFGALFKKGIAGDNLTNAAWCGRFKDEIAWRNRRDMYAVEFALGFCHADCRSGAAPAAAPEATTELSPAGAAARVSEADGGSGLTALLRQEPLGGHVGADQLDKRLSMLTPNYNAMYSLQSEFFRLGLPNERWRLSIANDSYKLCPSYPALLAVPEQTSDQRLFLHAAERSKGRFPVLTWLHPDTATPLCRSSQPKSGIFKKALDLDEELLQAIRASCAHDCTLRIVDARPKLNARANALMGKGFESVGRLGNACIHFCNIENIHEMRHSLDKFAAALASSDDGTYMSAVEASKWLYHLMKVLQAARFIAYSLDCGDPVLVHCSDGWDRTSQLSSLSQLLLDPFYRTIHGFQVLVEKDWCSFGHMFDRRTSADAEEKSPIFLQFVDVVFQLTRQFPTAFEFNELYLLTIADAACSRLFTTFLGDCERARADRLATMGDLLMEQKNKSNVSGVSLWRYLSESYDSALFRNFLYASPCGGKSSLLRPSVDLRCMAIWERYHCRNGAHFFSNSCHPSELDLLRAYSSY